MNYTHSSDYTTILADGNRITMSEAVARLNVFSKQNHDCLEALKLMRSTMFAVRPFIACLERTCRDSGHANAETLKRVLELVNQAVNLRVDDMPQSEQQKRDKRDLEYLKEIRQPVEVIIDLVQNNKEFFGALLGDKCMARAANKLTQLVQEWKRDKALDNCVGPVGAKRELSAFEKACQESLKVTEAFKNQGAPK